MLRVSDYDRTRMDQIMMGEGDSFSRQLLRLIAKADGENRESIRKGFPDHVALYTDWVMRRGEFSPKEEEFKTEESYGYT